MANIRYTDDAMVVEMTKAYKDGLMYANAQFTHGNQWEQHIVTYKAFMDGHFKALEILNKFIKDKSHFNQIVEYYFKPGQHQCWGDYPRTEHEKN